MLKVTLSLTNLPTGVFHSYSLRRSCPSLLRTWQSRSHHVNREPGQINMVVSKKRNCPYPTFSQHPVIFNWHLLLTFSNVPHLSLIVRSYVLMSVKFKCVCTCAWLWICKKATVNLGSTLCCHTNIIHLRNGGQEGHGVALLSFLGVDFTSWHGPWRADVQDVGPFLKLRFECLTPKISVGFILTALWIIQQWL